MGSAEQIIQNQVQNFSIASNVFINIAKLRIKKTNGPYPSCRLEARFWGQNDKNLHNFAVIIDTVVMTGR